MISQCVFLLFKQAIETLKEPNPFQVKHYLSSVLSSQVERHHFVIHRRANYSTCSF